MVLWHKYLSLLTLLLVSMLMGCTKTAMQMNRIESQANISALLSSIATPTFEPCFAVLLLHGLGGRADELEPVATKIVHTFGDAALILQPTCRAEWRSVMYATQAQARTLLQYLQFEFTKKSKQIGTFPLIIIGYSHGGVLACILGNRYQSQLNICGIVTLNAPLTGTPVLGRSHRDIQKFIANAHEGLQLIDPSKFSNSWKLRSRTLGLALPWLLSRWCPLAPGARDLVPGSDCTQEVYNFLRAGAYAIPCLLISGHQNDFQELFSDRAIANVLALNDAYAELIAGDKHELHDTLIPLRSQLCRGASFANLASDTEALTIMPMPGQCHIKGHIYNNITHCGNLVVLDPNLYVYGGESVLYSDRVLTDLMAFIKEKINNRDQNEVDALAEWLEGLKHI